MEPKTFNLHLYVNTLHSEQPTDSFRFVYGRGGRAETALDILDSADVPATFCLQGIDIALLQAVNPKLLGRMSQGNFDIVTAPYAHVLLSSSANQDNEARFAAQTYRKSQVRPTPLFMAPEFDITAHTIPLIQSLDARLVLLQDDTNVNQMYSYRPGFFETKPGAYVPTQLDNKDAAVVRSDTGSQVHGVMTLGNAEFRAPFLGMLRGVVDPNAVVAAHIQGLNRTQLPVGIGLIDAEAAYGTINWSKSNEPLRHFERYVHSLARSRDSGDIILEPFTETGAFGKLERYVNERKSDLPVIDHVVRPKSKWLDNLETGFDYGTKIDERARRLALSQLSEQNYRLLEVARSSDLKSAFFGLKRPNGVVARLPVQNGDVVIDKDQPTAVIIRSDSERPRQIEHIVRSIEENKSLQETTGVPLSAGSEYLMSVLHKATQ